MFKGLKPVIQFEAIHFGQAIIKYKKMWSKLHDCIECVAYIDVVDSFVGCLLLNDPDEERSDILVIFNDENQFGRMVGGRFWWKCSIEHGTNIISRFSR